MIHSVIFEHFFKITSDNDGGGSIGYDIPKFWRSITVFAGFASIVGFFGMRLSQQVENTEDAHEDDDARQPLLGQQQQQQQQSVSSLFKDITVLFYAIGYILISGSTETLVGNMGSILASVAAPEEPSPASMAFSLFAVFSTLARLLTGSSIDLLAHHGYSRFHIPIFVVSLPMCCAFLSLGVIPMTTTTGVLVALSLNGFCYGAMYCSGPVIAAEVWGVDNFGRNWGVLSYSPLIGSTVASFLYAVMYDAQAKKEHNQGNLCIGQTCFSRSLAILAVWIAVGAGFWLCAWSVAIEKFARLEGQQVELQSARTKVTSQAG